MTSTGSNELGSWAEEWELTLRTGEVSPETRRIYLLAVEQFLDHLAAEYPEVVDPAGITRRHVESWLTAMFEARRAGATRRLRLIGLRRWFKWLAADLDSGLTGDPSAGVRLPEPGKKPVPVINDDALAQLLGACQGRRFIDLRDTAIVRLLLDCGLRRAELTGIDLVDLDLRAQEVMVTGKGIKMRIVPFGAKTALALTRYLRARAKHRGAASPALFVGARPQVWNGAADAWRLTGDGVVSMLSRRCSTAGLPEINPHRFRHTWAHDLLDAGANESDVERLAGWTSPLMVRRYGASAADARARKSARRLSRGDRV